MAGSSVERFAGKTILITGGAGSIGFACASRFVQEGGFVVIADIDKESGMEAERKLTGRARFVQCDVRKTDKIRRAVAFAAKACGGQIDILVNSVAVHRGQAFLEISSWEFEDALAVNLLAPAYFSQECAKHMIRQIEAGREPGSIVNIASINALLAIADSVPYCVSKGGLLQLTRSTALALAPHGIRVNAVGPGSINTPANTESSDGVILRTPLKRKGEPDEIASVVAFLASGDSSYITGEIVYADGGRQCLNYTTN